MKRDFLNWFSGKSLEKAQIAADLLEQSIAQDCWVPKASVIVRAALNKTNVASKLASALRKETAENNWTATKLERLGVPDGANQYDPQYRAVAHMGWEIEHALQFGNFHAMSDVDFDACRAAANGNEVALAAINGAEQAARDFAEVYAAMARFDAMRPRPVFTTMGASKLVSETMKSMDAASVAVCPIEWETVERKNEKGQTVWVQIGHLRWPEGTQHGTSGKGGVGHNCEACGHKISNMFNWVPLVITTASGEKKSLWVGRDCSKTLFGIDMKGDLELMEGQR